MTLVSIPRRRVSEGPAAHTRRSCVRGLSSDVRPSGTSREDGRAPASLEASSAFCCVSARLLRPPARTLTSLSAWAAGFWCRLLWTQWMPLCRSCGVPSPWRLRSEFISPNVPHSVKTERRLRPPSGLPGTWLPMYVVRGWLCLWGDAQTNLRARPAHPPRSPVS